MAKSGRHHPILKSLAMADHEKLPIVQQPASPAKGVAGVGCEDPADRHWFLDALEDDEVREALKSSTAEAPCTNGKQGRA